MDKQNIEPSNTIQINFESEDSTTCDKLNTDYEVYKCVGTTLQVVALFGAFITLISFIIHLHYLGKL